MAKKISVPINVPMVTIGDRCIICGEVFAKKHPKDNRCICEKCCDKIARSIGAKDGREQQGSA